MKFTADRHFADLEAAARKLLDIVKASMAESGWPYAYTGATNAAFTRAGGSVQEYSADVTYAASHALFRIEPSGTRIELLPDGAE
jgi:hypothetical protein